MNYLKLSGWFVLGALCLSIASCSLKSAAPESVTLSGGAWLDKTNEGAELLRGLEIHLCDTSTEDSLKRHFKPNFHMDNLSLRKITFESLHKGLIRDQEHAKNVCIYSTQTDIDGKYAFEDISPNRYTLYASVSSEDVVVWWVEYVNLKTDSRTLDLETENAAGILTRYP